ncbi:hypothetical protein B0H13DRAFT_2266042 [Mycena leptocephala]|nr:hypothetical protein B0H13DRAFT_2266042 [Mycena leptocephala]
MAMGRPVTRARARTDTTSGTRTQRPIFYAPHRSASDVPGSYIARSSSASTATVGGVPVGCTASSSAWCPRGGGWAAVSVRGDPARDDAAYTEYTDTQRDVVGRERITCTATESMSRYRKMKGHAPFQASRAGVYYHGTAQFATCDGPAPWLDNSGNGLQLNPSARMKRHETAEKRTDRLRSKSKPQDLHRACGKTRGVTSLPSLSAAACKIGWGKVSIVPKESPWQTRDENAEAPQYEAWLSTQCSASVWRALEA